jgi:hypothetical protein
VWGLGGILEAIDVRENGADKIIFLLIRIRENVPFCLTVSLQKSRAVHDRRSNLQFRQDVLKLS